MEHNKSKQIGDSLFPNSNKSTSVKRDDLETTKKLEKLIVEMLSKTDKSISPRIMSTD